MSNSGYTICPCCGYDTVSDDTNEPELCSDCEEAGCEADGSEPGPGCVQDDSNEHDDELHPADSTYPEHDPNTLGGICPRCTP